MNSHAPSALPVAPARVMRWPSGGRQAAIGWSSGCNHMTIRLQSHDHQAAIGLYSPRHESRVEVASCQLGGWRLHCSSFSRRIWSHFSL